MFFVSIEANVIACAIRDYECLLYFSSRSRTSLNDQHKIPEHLRGEIIFERLHLLINLLDF